MPTNTLIVGKVGKAQTTTFEDLDREALRMRPSHIIVCEVCPVDDDAITECLRDWTTQLGKD